MKIPLYCVLLPGLFCCASACFAEQQPSMELLEFLGEWQDDQGELVDPFDYAEDVQIALPLLPDNPRQQPEQQVDNE